MSAGLFANYVSPRNDSNWPHFVRYRRDERLNLFFEQISRRDDPGLRFGCLGSGMLFRRDGPGDIAAVPDPPHAYVEMFIPSLTCHLGFDVVDFDAVSDLYAAGRWGRNTRWTRRSPRSAAGGPSSTRSRGSTGLTWWRPIQPERSCSRGSGH